jgi:hypothetical protein
VIVTRVATLAALTFSLSAQSVPRDLTGWDKIHWGMTIAEVRSAYGSNAQPESQDDWTLLQLPPIKMRGVEMGVQVGARQATGKISSVRLWSYFGLATSAPGASAQDFDTLRGLLIENYGQPAGEQTDRGENFRLIKTVRWTFPSTSVLLTLEASSSLPNLGKIFLEYTAAAK